MDIAVLDAVESRLASISANPLTVTPKDAEQELMAILTPIFSYNGYEIEANVRHQNYEIDFLAHREIGEDKLERMAIELKFSPHNRPFGAEAVHRLIGLATQGDFDQYLLLTNSGLSQAGLQVANQAAEVNVSVANFDQIRTWIARIRYQITPPASPVRVAVIEMAKALIRAIAATPAVLGEVEWRDLERLLAEALDGIGFKVELTRPAKDGGRDIICSCVEGGKVHSFIAEVKHWTCGQKVPGKDIKKFVNVVLKEQDTNGLFLSTSGFAGNAFEVLTEIEAQKVRFGDQNKIVQVCRTYVKAETGLWAPEQKLTEILMEDTSVKPDGKSATAANL